MKGFLHSLEVVIAAAIVIISISFIFTFPETVSNPDFVKAQGYDILEYLEYNGTLREMVFNNDVYSIRSSISELTNLNFDVDICEDCSMNIKSESVVVLDYYFSGYRDYNPKKLRLYLWE